MAAATSAPQLVQPAFPVPVITNQLQLGKVTLAYSSTQYTPTTTAFIDQTGISELALPILVQFGNPSFTKNLTTSLVTLLPFFPNELLNLISEYCPPEVELSDYPGILEELSDLWHDHSIPIPKVVRVPYMTVMIVHPPIEATLPAPEQLLSFFHIDSSLSCYDLVQHVDYSTIRSSCGNRRDLLQKTISSTFVKVICHTALPQDDASKPYACHSDHLSVTYTRENQSINPNDLMLYHRIIYTIPTTENTKAPMSAFSLHSYVLEHTQELREIMAESSRRHSLSIAEIDRLYCAEGFPRKPSLLRRWTDLMDSGSAAK